MVIPFIVYVVLFILVIFFYVKCERLKDRIRYYEKLEDKYLKACIELFDCKMFLIEKGLSVQFVNYKEKANKLKRKGGS